MQRNRPGGKTPPRKRRAADVRRAVQPAAGAGAAVHLTADQVKPERQSWLWEPYLPSNVYGLIEGDEAVGKSLFVAALVADLTGGPRIDGGRRRRPGRPVLYLPAEEGLTSQVVPRLRAAGAVLSLVSFGPRASSTARAWRPVLPDDLGRLHDEVFKLRPAAVILEPLVSFFSDACDWRRDQDGKRVLDPLALLAEEANTLILAARHWTKSGAGHGTARGMGGRVISGNARVVVQLAREETAGDDFALALVKWASAEQPPARRYTLVPGKGWAVFKLGRPLDLKADLLARATSKGAAQKMLAARLLLRQRVADDWVPVADLIRAAKADGISDTVLYEAKALDGVVHKWDTRATPKRSLWGPPRSGWPDLNGRG